LTAVGTKSFLGRRRKVKFSLTRSMAGRLPKRSARIAITIEPIQEPNKKIKIKNQKSKSKPPAEKLVHTILHL
jgi:hypothetical protein